MSEDLYTDYWIPLLRMTIAQTIVFIILIISILTLETSFKIELISVLGLYSLLTIAVFSLTLPYE